MANIQVYKQRIRTTFDISKWMLPSVTDLISGGAIQIANGADIQWEMMFSYGTMADSPSTVIDFTGIASVVIALQTSAQPHEGTTYWSATILNANILNTVTAATWNGAGTVYSATAQQICALIPNLQNAVAITGGNTVYWVVIYGVTTDATPKYVPYASFQVTVVDTGMPAGTPVSSPSFSGYMSFLCSDGLYRKAALVQNPDGGWVITVLNQTGTASP